MRKLLFSASSIILIVMVFNFAFKIYLSYEISKESIGVFYTFMDFTTLGVMAFAGYKDALIKAFDSDNFEKILYWYIYSFWGLFILILGIEIVAFKQMNFQYPLYFLVLLLFFNILVIFFSYLNSAFKIYKVMLFENLMTSLGLIISFFILSHFLRDIYALLFSFIFSFIARTLFILRFSTLSFRYKKSAFNEAKGFLKNVVLSGGMYFISGLFISMSGILILKLFKDTSFLAEYQVVIKSIFFSLVAVFVFPLNSFLFPEISKFIAKQNFAEIIRMEKKLFKYLILFFVMLFLLTFITKYLIGFLFPKDYKESYKYLNQLLVFLPFIAYTTFALNIIKGFDRFDWALFVRIIGSGVFFISIFIFYYLGFKANSVIYSLDLAFVSMAGVAFYFRRKLL